MNIDEVNPRENDELISEGEQMLFDTLCYFEMELCKILDMEWTTSNQDDMLKAVSNLKDGKPVYEGIDDLQAKFNLPLDKLHQV